MSNLPQTAGGSVEVEIGSAVFLFLFYMHV